MFSRKWCFNPYLFAKIEVVENEADKNIFLSNHNLQFEVESHFNSFSNFCMKIWVSGSSISDLFSTKNPQFIYTQCCSSTFRDLIVDTRICQPNQGPLKNWKEHSQELHLLKIHSRGAPITTQVWMGVVFWTMSFYNPKKFISRSI